MVGPVRGSAARVAVIWTSWDGMRSGTMASRAGFGREPLQPASNARPTSAAITDLFTTPWTPAAQWMFQNRGRGPMSEHNAAAAEGLLREWTRSESLVKHGLAVATCVE